MTTATAAMDALRKVGHDGFVALAGDPTWGALYATVVWELRQPFFVHDNLNTVYLYKTGGQPDRKGLGFSQQWRFPRVRCDILCSAYDQAEQTWEKLRALWIADMEHTPVVNAVGQGYLRATGGLKGIDIGESASAPWEDLGIVYRRIADVIVEIGD